MNYKELADQILSLTEEQQNQPVQVVKCTPVEDEVQECMPAICLDTVSNLEIFRCRSSHNNLYCGGDFVLLLDHNPFSEDGAIAHQVKKDAKDIFDTFPIYGKGGKTSLADQTSDVQLSDLSRANVEKIKNRLNKFGDAEDGENN